MFQRFPLKSCLAHTTTVIHCAMIRPANVTSALFFPLPLAALVSAAPWERPHAIPQAAERTDSPGFPEAPTGNAKWSLCDLRHTVTRQKKVVDGLMERSLKMFPFFVSNPRSSWWTSEMMTLQMETPSSPWGSYGPSSSTSRSHVLSVLSSHTIYLLTSSSSVIDNQSSDRSSNTIKCLIKPRAIINTYRFTCTCKCMVLVIVTDRDCHVRILI